jgi:hypothetical protein
MRGSTRKRGKTWTAYWFVADPETGAQRQTSKGGFARQMDAEAHLDEVVPAARMGTYAEPSKQLFRDYLMSEWLPAIDGTVRPLTFASYERTAQIRCGAQRRRRTAAPTFRRKLEHAVERARARGPERRDPSARAHGAAPRAQ